MTTRTWDIFCSVVDNYGDIGVCWRLARQLAAERKQSVRLWVDELAPLHQLCRAVDAAKSKQSVAGVALMRWDANAVWETTAPADICIEGFGARLPPEYLAAMARAPHKTVWINLEYLSAEPWVASHHALPSPQPDGVLTKYFFFPGFTRETGGLIVEQALAARRDAFLADARALAALPLSWSKGQTPPPQNALWISLFCYDNAALAPLLTAWSHSPQPIACVVPEGRALQQVTAIAGSKLVSGALTVLPIPFLEQDDYDRLLWACDINFVRGEDSFVRAQLAGRPLVWQAYPQDGQAHLAKMTAFTELYTAGLEQGGANAVTNLFDAWNRQTPEIGPAWSAFKTARPALLRHATRWGHELMHGPNLARRLAHFCENQLK